jgi:hypothetical protein
MNILQILSLVDSSTPGLNSKALDSGGLVEGSPNHYNGNFERCLCRDHKGFQQGWLVIYTQLYAYVPLCRYAFTPLFFIIFLY